MRLRFSNHQGKKKYQLNCTQLDMFKIQHGLGFVERSGLPNLRMSLPCTFISMKTDKINLFWLDRQHKSHENIIFFNIVGNDHEHSCNGYDHNNQFPPQIIHVGATTDPNIYIVFIVYSDEVIRLRLVLNTSAESSSQRLEIISIYSWNIRIYDIPIFKAKMQRLSFPDGEEVENVDDIIRYLEINFGQNSFGFGGP